MKAILIVAGLAALASGSARAAPADASALEPAFKGTIVSTYPDGRQGKLWLSADGSYRAEGRRHDPSRGTWKLKGDQICLKKSGVPFNYCTAVPSDKEWSAKAVTGEPIKVKVVPGRG